LGGGRFACSCHFLAGAALIGRWGDKPNALSVIAFADPGAVGNAIAWMQYDPIARNKPG
jgi:hypothetical protein